ncbi:uncharacterized protein ISCGN_017523 [Ixodes scapularis]
MEDPNGNDSEMADTEERAGARFIYTAEEKALLQALVTKHARVLENKKTNNYSKEAKLKAWEKLSTEYNSQPNVRPRSAKQLKKRWENEKSRYKKTKSDETRDIHATGMLRESQLYDKLLQLVDGHSYVLYGDPAYPLRPLLLKPYGSKATPAQVEFNKAMSTVRQAVEWGFGKVVAEFAFVDFKKNQKIRKQKVALMYRVAVLLSNCHTCIYGSQITSFFDLDPPTLIEYLQPMSR